MVVEGVLLLIPTGVTQVGGESVGRVLCDYNGETTSVNNLGCKAEEENPARLPARLQREGFNVDAGVGKKRIKRHYGLTSY